jgi:mono/diheme cytochrome c family protein
MKVAYACPLAAAAIFGLALAGSVAAQAPAGGPPAPAADAARIEKGRQLFTDSGCANCHTLADAAAAGRVGPSLDGNANLSADYISQKVANGGGPMPSFGGQLSPEEIGAVAAYVMHASQK